MSTLRLTDPRVIAAVQAVDRRAFLAEPQRDRADADAPLPIGAGQTTSQPSLIAWQLEHLTLTPTDRVLEVGTGCGYQTALLAALAAEVFSVEVLPSLHAQAAATLARLGVRNVSLRLGDGYLGWPDAAPFDAIIVCAGAAKVPEPLLEQLAPNGRLLAPIGQGDALSLDLVAKSATGGLTQTPLLPVRFVPLTGPLAARDRNPPSQFLNF